MLLGLQYIRYKVIGIIAIFGITFTIVCASNFGRPGGALDYRNYNNGYSVKLIVVDNRSVFVSV